jgi:hypothetical protein
MCPLLTPLIIAKRYISWKSRYIRYIVELERFNPLHFSYTKSYIRYIIVRVVGWGCIPRKLT